MRNLFRNLAGSVTNMAMLSKDMVIRVGFRQDVESHSTQLAGTIYIPSSLSRIDQTFTWVIPTLLTIWEMVTGLSSIINWCICSMFSCMIAVLGRPVLKSSSGLYIYTICNTWILLPTSAHCIQHRHHPQVSKPCQHECPWNLTPFCGDTLYCHGTKFSPFLENA